jgi:hypothetical protein
MALALAAGNRPEQRIELEPAAAGNRPEQRIELEPAAAGNNRPEQRIALEPAAASSRLDQWIAVARAAEPVAEAITSATAVFRPAKVLAGQKEVAGTP